MLNLKLFIWVYEGRQRQAVLKAMGTPMTARQILAKSHQYNKKLSRPNTNDVLRGFVKRGLAVCVNPKARRGREYQLTPDGEEIRRELFKVE